MKATEDAGGNPSPKSGGSTSPKRRARRCKGASEEFGFRELGLPGCQVVGVGLRVSDFVDTVNRVTEERLQIVCRVPTTVVQTLI